MGRVCPRKPCNFRVHWLCYLRWYFNDNYRAYCPCGCYINTYRFGLPPSFKTMEAISRRTRRLAPDQVEISPSNRWYCRCCPDWNAETQLHASLILYFVTFFILAGYLGKLLLWKVLSKFQVDFWTLTGFCYHFMGWMISCVLLALIKALLVECPGENHHESRVTEEDNRITIPVNCQTSV